MPRPKQQDYSLTLIPVAIHTPGGMFIARFSSRGLAKLDFPRRYAQDPQTKIATLPAEMQGWIRTTERAVLATLAGESVKEMPPFDLSMGTPFQQRVWEQLRAIKVGQTKSYGAIASAVGSPRAARAVGAACGANPIPLLIPCHRVLAAGVALGGFSGGLDWKLRLLAAEGVEPGSGDSISGSAS